MIQNKVQLWKTDKNIMDLSENLERKSEFSVKLNGKMLK